MQKGLLPSDCAPSGTCQPASSAALSCLHRMYFRRLCLIACCQHCWNEGVQHGDQNSTKRRALLEQEADLPLEGQAAGLGAPAHHSMRREDLSQD